MESTPVVNGGMFGLFVACVMFAFSVRDFRHSAWSRFMVALATVLGASSASVIFLDNKAVTWASGLSSIAVAFSLAMWLLVKTIKKDVDKYGKLVALTCIVGAATTSGQAAFNLGRTTSMWVNALSGFSLVLIIASAIVILYEPKDRRS